MSRAATHCAVLLCAAAICAAAIYGAGPRRASADKHAVRCGPGHELEVLAQRESIKRDLVFALIAGRVTLADVADRFLALNRQRPDILADVRRSHPADTDEESAARNVIHYALNRIDDPIEEGRVARRLWAEFRLLFPDSPEAPKRAE